jgi:hypothetical protein
VKATNIIVAIIVATNVAFGVAIAAGADGVTGVADVASVAGVAGVKGVLLQCMFILDL